MQDERTCFQCGNPRELVMDQEAIDSGWFTCQHCGERIVSLEESLRQIKLAEEERIRKALGVDVFRPSR